MRPAYTIAGLGTAQAYSTSDVFGPSPSDVESAFDFTTLSARAEFDPESFALAMTPKTLDSTVKKIAGDGWVPNPPGEASPTMAAGMTVTGSGVPTRSVATTATPTAAPGSNDRKTYMIGGALLLAGVAGVLWFSKR